MSARFLRGIAAHGMFAGLLERRFIGDASWALFGQIGSGIVLLLGTRILTELITPEAYGQCALMVGIVALGVNNLSSPFIGAGMRLMPEAVEQGQRGELMRILRGLSNRAIVVALLLMAMAGAAYTYVNQSDPRLFAAAGLLLAVTVRRELGIQMLIGERRQREASLWQTSDSVLRPAVAIGLVVFWGGDAVLVLLGYALASAAINALWTMLSRADCAEALHHRSHRASSLRREVLAYAWPLIPMELVGWFNTLGDRYVIAYFMTAAEVGVYAAAYTLINEAFNRSSMVLLRSFQPVYFNHFSRRQREAAHRVFRFWLLCVVAVGLAEVLALVFLKDWVSRLLLAESYQSAADLMPVIGAGCALQAVGIVLAQPLYARKRTRLVLLGRIVGAVSAAVSIPLLVQWQGLMGAAIAAPLYFGIEAIAFALIARPWSPCWLGVSPEIGECNEI